MEPSPAQILERLNYSPGEVDARRVAITQTLLAESPLIRSAQFESLGADDLEHLFRLYDRHFFDGSLSWLIKRAGSPPVGFRLSNRMTSAAGKTTVQRSRRLVGGGALASARYEIAISSLLLFQTFPANPTPGDAPRAIEVAGVRCSNRLEALLRIFEHELLHLAEFLASGRSSCAAAPFRRLSQRIFGHAASVHTLITPVEAAARTHAIRLGDRVAFDHGGAERVGKVCRITRRASVLVADRAGRPYSDGQRYLTFLVPLDRLRRI